MTILWAPIMLCARTWKNVEDKMRSPFSGRELLDKNSFKVLLTPEKAYQYNLPIRIPVTALTGSAQLPRSAHRANA